MLLIKDVMGANTFGTPDGIDSTFCHHHRHPVSWTPRVLLSLNAPVIYGTYLWSLKYGSGGPDAYCLKSKLIEAIGNTFLPIQGKIVRSFTRTQMLDWNELVPCQWSMIEFLQVAFSWFKCVCLDATSMTPRLSSLLWWDLCTWMPQWMKKTSNETTLQGNVHVHACNHIFEPQKHSPAYLFIPHIGTPRVWQAHAKIEKCLLSFPPILQ